MACVGYNDLHKKFSFMRVAGSRQLLLLLLLCVCVSEGQDEVEYMGDPFINKNVVTVVVHFTPPPLPRRMKQEPATEEADSAVEDATIIEAPAETTVEEMTTTTAATVAETEAPETEEPVLSEAPLPEEPFPDGPLPRNVRPPLHVLPEVAVPLEAEETDAPTEIETSAPETEAPVTTRKPTSRPKLTAGDARFLLHEERDQEKQELDALKKLKREEEDCNEDKMCLRRLRKKEKALMKKSDKRVAALEQLLGRKVVGGRDAYREQKRVKKMWRLKQQERRCTSDACRERIRAKRHALYQRSGVSD